MTKDGPQIINFQERRDIKQVLRLFRQCCPELSEAKLAAIAQGAAIPEESAKRVLDLLEDFEAHGRSMMSSTT